MRVNAGKLELTGNAVSLSGKGTFKLDGSDLNLNFSPTWARMDQFLPESIRDLAGYYQEPADYRNAGKVDDNPDHLKFNKRIVPFLVDPLIQVRGGAAWLGMEIGSGARGQGSGPSAACPLTPDPFLSRRHSVLGHSASHDLPGPGAPSFCWPWLP